VNRAILFGKASNSARGFTVAVGIASACSFPSWIFYHFRDCHVENKRDRIHRAKYWEIISKAGWSWGCVATIDSNGRTIFVADAHRDDGKRFVVHADEKLSAFIELESAICAGSGY
jgi:hypothetical protein